MNSIINDSVITYKKIKGMPETASIDPVDKKSKYKINYYVFHTVLLVTICLLLLIIIDIKLYYIKPQLKQ